MVETASTVSKKIRRAASNFNFVNLADSSSEDEESYAEPIEIDLDESNPTGKRTKRKIPDISSKKRIAEVDNSEDLLNLIVGENTTDNDYPGVVLQLNKYFPFPMSLEKPANTNLLFLRTLENMRHKIDPMTEMKPVMVLEYMNHLVGIKMHLNTSPETLESDRKKFLENVVEKVKSSDYYTENVAKPIKYEKLNPDGTRYCQRISDSEIRLERRLVPKDCSENDWLTVGVNYAWENSFYECYRYFFEKVAIHVYLDIGPESIQKIYYGKPHKFFHDLCSSLQCGQLRNGYYSTGAQVKIKLSDTFDYPEAVVPEGFNLKLRDYQLRSLSWMRAIESTESLSDGQLKRNFSIHPPRLDYKIQQDIAVPMNIVPVKIQLGNSDVFADPFHKVFTKDPKTSRIEPLRIKGGILADDTGSGKTITCLALVHSAPFTMENFIERAKNLMNVLPYRIPSRATCVVCPSNLHKQWLDEARSHCPNLNVIGLACIRDHQKMSWKDLMTADLVVVSYQFLTNTNYRTQTKLRESIQFEMENHLDTKGRCCLEWMQFYRLMFDEMHEMEHKTVKCKEVARSLKADFHWGITGTPKFESTDDVVDLFPYLNISTESSIVFKKNYMAEEEFLQKFVKRNVPDLKLPPVTNEVVWVTATSSELALLNLVPDKSDIRSQIMMCSHYQIADSITGLVGDAFITIDNVKQLLLKSKLDEMHAKEQDLEYSNSSLRRFKKLELPTGPKEREKHLTKLERLKQDVEMAKTRFETATGSYNFFINTFNALNESADNNCLICYDTILPASLSMLPCSHLFCFECVTQALEVRRKCPMCGFCMQDNAKILRIKQEEKVIASKVKDSGLDTSKYGSKLIELYNYLSDLIESDPNARIILFLQYRNLANFISETLTELSIKHVRVSGNVFMRQGAIQQFTTSKDVRLIMLSSEDSVSGINLTQATHVVLLHPFWSGQGEAVDLAYEKQGISRAYRSGLNHPLKVVRFAVKDTIEEELTNQRLTKF